MLNHDIERGSKKALRKIHKELRKNKLVHRRKSPISQNEILGFII